MVGASLLVVGVGIGWFAGRTSSSAATPRADGDACVDANHKATAAVGSESEAELSALVADWYESGFRLALGLRGFEDQLRERAIDDPETRALIASAIERAPENQLLQVVSAITRVDEEYLETKHDVRTLARRLAEVAWEEPAEAAPEKDSRMEVAFADAAHPASLRDPDDAVFGADTTRIYASISGEGYEGDRVMVKWFDRDSMKIESLRSFRYGRGDLGVWAFVEHASGWRPGLYQVNVYRQDDAMTLIGQGTYTVE